MEKKMKKFSVILSALFAVVFASSILIVGNAESETINLNYSIFFPATHGQCKAKEAGITFFKLSDEELQILKQQGNKVHQKYADEINKLSPGDTYKPENFLKEVQEAMGYKE